MASVHNPVQGRDPVRWVVNKLGEVSPQASDAELTLRLFTYGGILFITAVAFVMAAAMYFAPSTYAPEVAVNHAKAILLTLVGVGAIYATVKSLHATAHWAGVEARWLMMTSLPVMAVYAYLFGTKIAESAAHTFAYIGGIALLFAVVYMLGRGILWYNREYSKTRQY